ncbi:MAG TPA: ankyrin repeat domain-containing protein [Candidatus Babeliales bacterium]|nr:ankyrin repeat domain-containing protein [Candidatus Babeliales bacterium]
MKLTKKISCLITLLSFIIPQTYAMETSPQTGWLAYAGSTLLNGYTGFKQFLTNITTTNSTFPFGNLPTDVQTEIIQLLASSCTDKTLEESTQTINALARTNKYLNNLINDPQFNLELIKSRAKQFNVADMKVARELHTKASKKQLKIQLMLAKIMKEPIEEQENDGVLPKLNKLLQGFKVEDKTYKVDLDFTYRLNTESPEYTSPLVYAVQHDNKFLINYLIKNGANINQAGYNGKTPLMYTENAEIITFLAEQPNLNINQQDAQGNTALLRAIQNYFPEDEESGEQNIALIQALLDNNANPTIANNNGATPLKAAEDIGDQEVIDSVQHAIEKINDNKHIINEIEE